MDYEEKSINENPVVGTIEEMISQVYAADTAMSITPQSALRCGAVFACVGLLAESIAQLPIKVYKIIDGEKHEDKTHWLYTLLSRRPCSWLNSFNWRELAMMCLCLRGDFYAYKVRDGAGIIRELLPLLPGAISVRQLNNWELEYRINLADGTSKTVPQSEIFHVMYRSLDGVKGLSPIGFARNSISLSLAAEGHGYSTFTNGAKPGGVLKVPAQLSEEAYNRLKRGWESAYSGENAGKTAILEKGTEFQPLSMSNSDAQYLEIMKFQVEQISRIFRVPLFMIQSTEKSTSWGSGIEQMSLGFVRYTLLPWIKRWENAIFKDIISEIKDGDYDVKLNVEGLERGSMATRFDAYQKGINMGVYSPNEIRRLEDMNPRDGGDIYLTPLNMRIGEDNSDVKNQDEEPNKEL